MAGEDEKLRADSLKRIQEVASKAQADSDAEAKSRHSEVVGVLKDILTTLKRIEARGDKFGNTSFGAVGD